jgi:hypothetical protein
MPKMPSLDASNTQVGKAIAEMLDSAPKSLLKKFSEGPITPELMQEIIKETDAANKFADAAGSKASSFVGGITGWIVGRFVKSAAKDAAEKKS